MSEPTSTTIAAGVAALSFITKILLLGLCIFLGANAHAVTIYKSARQTKEVYGKYDYIFNLFGGIFAGIVFALVAMYSVDNDFIIMVSGGLGAFMGYAGLKRLGDFLFKIMERHNKC